MTAGSLAAEPVARVSQWHTFISFSKSAADGRGQGERGEAGGAMSLALHIHIAEDL